MRKHFLSYASILTVILLFAVSVVNAQAATAPQQDIFPTWMNADCFLVITAMLFFLLLVIVLGNTGINLSKAAVKMGTKSFATVLLFLASVTAFAESSPPADAKSVASFPKWADNPDVYLLTIIFFVLAFAVYALYRANISLLEYINPHEVSEEGIKAATSKAKPHFIRRWYKNLAGGVPLAEEKDILLDHDYDGIKELDNKLPPWWLYGFYITVVFAVIYLFSYHVMNIGKLSHEEYQAELKQAEMQKEKRLKAGANNINESNVVALANEDEIAKGKETFVKFCSPCHKTDGGGMVGPNLTDEYWLHGGGIKNVFKTITYGIPAKGMLSWKAQLSPKQIQEVASFVLTLKGTNPPGAKEPQGDMWVEESAPVQTADSAKTTHAAAVILLSR